MKVEESIYDKQFKTLRKGNGLSLQASSMR